MAEQIEYGPDDAQRAAFPEPLEVPTGRFLRVVPSEKLEQSKQGEFVEHEPDLAPEAARILSEARSDIRIATPLHRLKAEDELTYTHTMRVARSAMALAWMNRDKMGLTAGDLGVLARAALLHDIGKRDPEIMQIVKLDRTITDNERKIIGRHSLASAQESLQNFPGEKAQVALTAAHHDQQENPVLTIAQEDTLFDALQLDENELALVRKLQPLLEAADKFDAMAYARPYKKASPKSKIIEAMLKHAKAAEDATKEYYKGSEEGINDARVRDNYAMLADVVDLHFSQSVDMHEADDAIQVRQ